MTESPPELPVTDPPPATPSLPEKTAWNAWWTLLWAVAIFVLSQIVVTIGVTIVAATDGSLGSNPDLKDFAEKVRTVAMDGDVIGALGFLSIFIICPLCWLVGHFRPGWSGWEYLGNAKVRWFQWPLWAVITIACMIAFSLVAPHLGLPERDPSMVAMSNSTQFPILLFLGVAIGAPLIEEFVCRGVLFRGWRESRLGLVGTIILISLLWAIAHVQYPLLVIGFIFILGILLGIAREVTGSLWIPVWMHFVNNSLAAMAMLSF